MIYKNIKSILFFVFMLSMLNIFRSQESPLNATAFALGAPVLNTTDCFYDSVENTLIRLDERIKEFAILCNVQADPSIMKILAIGNAVSKLAVYTNSTAAPAELILEVKSLAQNQAKNWTFAEKALDVANNMIDNPTRGEAYLANFWSALIFDWDAVSELADYPIFNRESVKKMVFFQRLTDHLNFYYKENTALCLPINIKIKSLDDLPTSSALDNFEIFRSRTKQDANEFVIDPLYLYEAGVIVTFWVNENIETIEPNKKITVFEGYSGSKKVYELSFIRSGESDVINNFQINDEIVSLPSDANCNDLAFVVFSFQKDEDQYKLTVSMRFVSSDKRVSFEKLVPTHIVENIRFIFVVPGTANINMYKQLTYSAFKEISLMIIGTDTTQFNTLSAYAQTCSNTPDDCKYFTSNGCLVCIEGKMNLNNQCVDVCPEGYYQNVRKCEKCSDKCSKCTSSESDRCVECFDPYVLFGSTCQTRCPDNMFPTDRICKECTPNCVLCASADSCKVCDPETFLMKGKCVKTCDSGYFKELNPNVCKQCQSSCTECSGTDKCTSCAEGFFLLNGNCLRTCPSQMFADSNSRTCTNCPLNCQECVDEVFCKVCIDGFNLQSNGRLCATDCPLNTASFNGVCINCTNKDCDSCQASKTSICNRCNDSTFLKNSDCVTTCGQGYYLDAALRSCLPCSTENCITCSKDKCFQCVNGLFVLDDSLCVPACPDGNIESGSICMKCKYPSECKKCSLTNIEVCTQCYPNKFLLEGKCVDSCPDGYFLNGQNCQKCADGCRTCKDQFTCEYCLPNWFKKGNTCVTDCGSGFAIVDGICTQCPVLDCATCNPADVSECQKCKADLYLYTNKCRNNCPAGTFSTAAFTCQDCVKDCEQCDNKSTCNKCFAPYVLQNNVCQSDCNDGYVNLDGVCTKCTNLLCKKCDSSLNTCVDCPINRFLFYGTCVDRCEDGNYTKDRACINCVKPCKNCINENECTKCIETFSLFGTTCTDNCPDGTAKVGDKCENCPSPNCQKCNVTELQKCEKCNENFFLLNGNCYSECPIGHFSLNNICYPCLEGCKKCLNALSCSQCENGLFLLENNKCVSNCPDGFMSDLKTESCQRCKSSCRTCTENVSQCTSCYESLLLYQGDCLTDCPDTTFISNGHCLPCEVKDCGKCPNGVLCRKCNPTRLLKENTCISAPCPEGYTQVDDTCEKCEVTNCKTCPSTNTKVCNECTVGNFLYQDYICDSTCPITTFKNTSTGKCQNCDTSCSYCTDDKHCTKCDTNYYLLDNICVKDCPDQYHRAEEKCLKCEVTGCKSCTTDSNTCNTCLNPLVLFNNECRTECPDNYYNLDGTCSSCPVFCKNCLDVNVCTKCDTPKLLTPESKCSDNCPDKTVAIDGVCKKCETAENCKKCDTADLTKCQECTGTLVLLDNKCIPNCPEKYFDDQRVCQNCIKNCLTCTNAITCDVCVSNMVLQDGKCQEFCRKGFYNFNGKCLPCEDNCEKCNGETCTKCSPNLYLENGDCKPQCSKGYFADFKMNCLPCGENCISCKNENTCDTCKEGFYLKNGLCVSECGNGFVINNQSCVACESGCSICDPFDLEKCVKCNEDLVLFNFDCKTVCPPGTFKNEKSECQNCVDNCDVCTNSETCDVCKTTFNLQQSKTSCKVTCDDGYTAENGVCVPCKVTGCKKCANKDQCEECTLPYLFLNKSACVSTCPDGTFIIENRCDSCPSECKTCQNPDICTSCIDTFVLNKNKCVNNCDAGQVAIRGECINCADPGCKVCDTTLTNCLECSSNKFLLTKVIENKTKTECVNDCGNGYFSLNGKCDVCIASCDKCTNSIECNQCAPGFVLQDGICKDRCDPHNTERNGKCIKCTNPQCQVCDNLTTTICSRCDPGYVLKNNDCVTECGDSFHSVIYDEIFGICKPCLTNCKKCQDKLTCDECNSGFFHQENECVSQCSLGYVLKDNKTCVKCTDPLCQVCDPNLPDVCTQCNAPFVLQNGKCLNGCSPSYFGDINRICVPCTDVNCISCNPESNCQNCNSGFFIYAKGCVANCPSGYVADSNNKCVACEDTNCTKCNVNDLSKCLTCNSGFYLQNGFCVKECFIGTFPNLSNECQTCPANCVSCISETHCTDCTDPMVLDTDFHCKDNCPDGKVDVEGTCKSCPKKCNKCDPSNTKTCLECTLPLLLHDNKCLEECPEGTFISGRDCRPCDPNCKTCSSYTSCLTCNDPLFLQDMTCVNNCRSGFVGINGKCVECTDSQKTDKCLPENPDISVKCKSPFFLNDGKCVSECGTGKFPDATNTCQSCQPNCQECLNATQCIKCINNFSLYNGECVEECPLKTVSVQGVCKECTNTNCDHCSPSNLSKCTACPSYKIFYLADCLTKCPDKTFYSIELNTCSPCNSTCQICSDSNTCTKCIENYVLDEGKCTSNCPDGKVPRDDVCLSCADPSCKVCSPTDLSICLECKNGFLYKNSCLTTCGFGLREDLAKKTCEKCPVSCNQCTETQCNKCKSGFYFAEGTNDCVVCNEPYQVIEDTCYRCKSDSCLKCVNGDPSKCSVCQADKVLVNGECIQDCPETTFKNGQKCLLCSKNCLRCLDEETCSKCDNSTVLYNNFCVASCPVGWVANTQGICIKCTQNSCDQCSKDNLSKCEKCASGTFKYKDICYKSCPEETYASVDTCVDCPATCSHCDAQKCNSCKAGYKLKGTQCVTDCGESFVDNGSTCTACSDVNCSKCDPFNICKKCKNGTLLTIDGTCVVFCPDGFYPDTEKGVCVGCQNGCLKCDVNKCTLCAEPMFLESGRCVQICSTGMTNVNGVCQTCNQKECLQCIPNDTTKCSICEEGKLLYQQQCVDRCPKGSFNADDKICQDCDKTCLDCDKNQCLECKPEFIMNLGKCENECPDGKVFYADRCIKCDDENCKTCLTDTKICVNCKSPFKLVDTICKDTCPEGYYQNEKELVCNKCSEGCDVCTGLDSCSGCETGFYLENGKCVRSCPVGLYGDCASKTCRPCDEACQECYGPTNQDCIKCSKDYFVDDKSCVKPDNCRVGTYANFEKSECISCKVPFCKECLTETECKTCQTGFQLSNKECVEAKTFVNALKSAQLFSIFTATNFKTREVLSFNEDLKGIAVGDSEVSFSFWVRKLKNSLPGTVIFHTKSPNSTIQTIQMSTVKTSAAEYCQFQVTSTRTGKSSKIQTIDCSYNGLYNWTFFSVTFTKNKDGTSLLKITVSSGSSLETFNLNIPSDSSEIISKDTMLYFNENNLGFDGYEISNFNILDYTPTSNEISSFNKQTPDNCDYSCSECRGVCINCINGVLKDNYCPAAYMPIKPFITPLNTNISLSIRQKLTKRFVSDRYALAFFFYVTNLNEIPTQYLASLHYDTLDSTTSPLNKVIDVTIVQKKIVLNETIKFDHQDLKSNIWYMMVIGFKENYSIMYLKELNQETLFKQENIFIKNMPRIFDDLNVLIGNVYTKSSDIHIKGSTFNSRLYLNNIPTEQEVNEYFKTADVPTNCKIISEDFSCVECNDGYKLSSDKICVDNTLEQRNLLMSKLSLWRNDSLEIIIPETLKRESFAVSFWLRKKRPSSVSGSNTYSLLSLQSPDKVRTPIITAMNQVNYVTDLMFLFENNDSFIISHDYSNELHEYINIIMNVDFPANTIQFSVVIKEGTEQRVYEKTGTLTKEISSFVFGDAQGNEMNWEVAQMNYFFKSLNNENIIKIRAEVPKDCDPACLDCNYTSGICKTCFIKTSVNVATCPVFLKGFTSTYLYSINSFTSIVNPEAYVTNLIENFKQDVNSLKYGIIGYFKVFDWNKITTSKNAKFQIAQLSNFDHDNTIPKYPGKNLITLELVVTEGVAQLFWVLDELDVPTYYPFTPQPNLSTGDWIYVYGGVTVAEKTFKSKYMINNAISQIQIITLKNFPQRLSERASMGVFGIKNRNSEDASYKVPNGQLSTFYYTINNDYTDAIFEAFRKKNTIPITPTCSSGCLKCVVNSARVNICLQCGTGFTVINDTCVSTAISKIGYMVLNDYWDDLEKGVKYDLSKFNFVANNPNYSISFYIRRNFYPEANDKTTILTFGKLTAYTALNLNDYYLYVSIEGESNIISLGPFDFDPAFDYRWYAVTLSFFTTTNKIQGILSNVDKTVVKSQTVTLINKFNQGNSIFLATPKFEVQVFGAHISDDNMIFPLVNVPSDSICDVDCDSCQNGVCNACTYGIKSSSCFPTSIRMPNKYISKDNYYENFYSLSSYFGRSKLFRSKKFTFTFTLETKINSLINEYRILKFSNSKTDQNTSKNINTFLSLTYIANSKQFILRLSNRSLGLKVAQRQQVFEYPNEVTSNTHYIGIAFDGEKNTISIVFINNKDNFISETITKFDGMNDYITQNTNIFLNNNFSENVLENDYILYRDVKLKYLNADTDLTSFYNQLYDRLVVFQSACIQNTRNKCLKCNEKLVKGVCTQNDKSGIFFLNKIQQVTFISSVPAIKFTSTQVNKFTLSFWWRRINYDLKPFEVIKVSTGGVKPLDYLRVIYDNNQLNVIGQLGTQNEVKITNMYEDKDTFDWLHISVTYDIIPNNITVFVNNSKTGRTIQKTSLLDQKDNGIISGISANPSIVDQLYYLSIGITADDLNSGMAYSFETSSIIFTPNIVMTSQETDAYRVRRPIKCEDSCMTSCNEFDVCEALNKITSPIVISDPEINSNVNNLKSLNAMYQNRILGSALEGFAASHAYSYYLLSFELNIGSYVNSAYTANKDILMSITNYSADEIAELTMGDIIPEGSFKFGVFAVQHRNGVLRFYVGSNPTTNTVNFFDVTLAEPLMNYSKLYVSALMDSNRKYVKLFVTINDLTVPYEIYSETAPQLIFSSTMVYHHPALSNVRLNVHNPRFDYDSENFLYNSAIFSNTSNASSQCKTTNTPNCSKCLFVSSSNSFKCNKCLNGFKFTGEICLQEINSTSTK